MLHVPPTHRRPHTSKNASSPTLPLLFSSRCLWNPDVAVELGPNAGHGARAGHWAVLRRAEPPDSVHLPARGEGGGVPAVLEGRTPLPMDQGAPKRGQVRTPGGAESFGSKGWPSIYYV